MGAPIGRPPTGLAGIAGNRPCQMDGAGCMAAPALARRTAEGLQRIARAHRIHGAEIRMLLLRALEEGQRGSDELQPASRSLSRQVPHPSGQSVDALCRPLLTWPTLTV